LESKPNFLDRFKHYLDKIEQELNDTYHSNIELIDDISRHSLLGEGKRLRPLLFVLSAKLCSYQSDDIYRLSTIFEYIHSASLLHDDVIDNAELRRKKPSARNIWGNTAAVLTGDYLGAKAQSIALNCNNMEFSKCLNKTAMRMAEGQVMELLETDNCQLGKEKYMEIITAKTAELFCSACSSGAIISGANNILIRNLEQFGLNLGITFQLIDDLLDYTASEEEFGKPVGKDLKEGKITLPLIYTLAELEEKERKRLIQRIKKEKAKGRALAEAVEMVRKGNAVKQVRCEAEDYSQKASTYLEKLPDSQAKTDLIDLNTFLVSRSY
jgi:octaprenyl-diphosphate synthase